MITLEYKNGSKKGIGVTQIKYRKNKALCIFQSDEKEARIYPLAYFKDDESAKETEDMLNLIYDGLTK